MELDAVGAGKHFQRSWSAPAWNGHRRSMLEQESDVTFHVGRKPDIWRISAHKKILAQSNPVFHAMFQGFFSRTRQSGLEGVAADENIAVTDVEGRGFENLVSFLYGERIRLRSMSTALTTLQAAHKYMNADLMKLCIDYIQRELSTANVLQVFQYAVFYATNCIQPSQQSSPSKETLELAWPVTLLNACLHYIDTHASAVLASEEIEDLDRETLCLIVQRDSLQVVYESEVLDAVCRWAHCECRRHQLEINADNRRKVLGDLFWQVRFLAMSAQEFLVGPMMSGLFTVEEQLTLIGHFHNRAGFADLPDWLKKHVPRPSTRRSSVQSRATGITSGVPCKCSYRKRLSIRAKQHGTRIAEKLLFCLSYVFE